MDCLCALAIVTYEVDQKYGTEYNKRFIEFLKYMQKNDYTANAGVTDVKGDRALSPKDQPDPDVYLRVVEEREDGIVVRGAKAHQTGSLSSHETIVLPTRALKPDEKEFAVAFAMPTDSPGIVHVVGRSTLDMRELDGCDCGNTQYSKYCPTVIFDNVFVPWERVFLYGETEFAVDLVVKFRRFPPPEPRRLQSGQDRLHGGRGPDHDGLQRIPKGRAFEAEGHRYDPPGRNPLRLFAGLIL